MADYTDLLLKNAFGRIKQKTMQSPEIMQRVCHVIISHQLPNFRGVGFGFKFRMFYTLWVCFIDK